MINDKTRAAIASLLASDFDVVSTVADGQAAVPDPPRIVFATAYEDASIDGAASALGASAMRVDSRERIEHGELLLFDADEVLNRLMVGNRPDAECFEDTINPIVDKPAGGRKRPVRIYGEMVDVLWSSGRQDAALSLENLWHQLIAGRKCSLLCGYAVGRVSARTRVQHDCDRHSHVMPPHTAV